MPLKHMKLFKVLTDAIRKANCSLDMIGKNVLEIACMMTLKEA